MSAPPSELSSPGKGITSLAAARALSVSSAWKRWEFASEHARDEASRREGLLRQAEALAGAADGSWSAAAELLNVSAASIARWRRATKGLAAADRLPALLPRRARGGREADCSEAAWQHFLALWLNPAEPALRTCWERTRRLAEECTWAWPGYQAVVRRVRRDISREVQVLARQGPDAFDRLYPPMARTRSHLRALDGVVGDGVSFRPALRWPDGAIQRGVVWFWQDLMSGKLLAWRIDKTENKGVVRLATGDLIERWGLPRHAYVDNTRAAANKWLTGRVTGRHRFVVRDEDPLGLLPQCGIQMHFTLPHRGQSKPIERAFRDLREWIDRHPKFDQRGTLARPVRLAEFETVLAAEVRAHNARPGRRGSVQQGLSFDGVFLASYTTTPVRRAAPEQRRLWLLAAEKIRCRKESGHIVLGRGPQGENRYWAPALTDYAGKEVVVRFDPKNLQKSVFVYRLSGEIICEAPCCWAAGFDDSAAAQAYARDKKAHRRHARRALDAQRRMDIATAARKVPDAPDPGRPLAKILELCPAPAPTSTAAAPPAKAPAAVRPFPLLPRPPAPGQRPPGAFAAGVEKLKQHRARQEEY